jgi:septum formation protein
MQIFLASRSPRRRELLSAAGIPYACVDGDVDESLPPKVKPVDAVQVLASMKARKGAEACTSGYVLGADTLVALDEVILGKPRDRADARRMLQQLSGTCHQVFTGVALLRVQDGRMLVDHACTKVHMRVLSAQEIDAYVDSGESDDKAGAYAIQETADRFVTRLDGAYDNVVGLPVDLVRRMLKDMDLS